jgi:hypothetical protein
VVSVRLHSWAALKGEGELRAHLAAAMEAAQHNGSGIVLSDQLGGAPGGGGGQRAPKGVEEWEVVRMFNWRNWVV